MNTKIEGPKIKISNLPRSIHALVPSTSIMWALALGLSIATISSVRAEETKIEKREFKEAPLPPQSKKKRKSNDKHRNFYEVLEDVLADFEYDLKSGDVRGLKDLSIRNVATSENIPVSFKSHLELLVTERILKTTKTRIVRCLPCRSKRAVLNGRNIVITSPETNQEQLSRISKMQGIKNFMDVAFDFQPSGMMVSLYVSDSESGAVVWSRSYNSETSRAAAFRRGVDYSQVDEPRQYAEYKATMQYRPILAYLFQPIVGEYVGTITFGFRAMERYDNRKKEVGFELNYHLDSGTLIGAANTNTSNMFATFNATLLFVHAWNFLGMVENYNRPRGGLFAAVGGTYSPGYLGALIRVGWEWRLGKHWAVSVVGGYRPPGEFYSSGSSIGQIHGAEFGLSVGALF